MTKESNTPLAVTLPTVGENGYFEMRLESIGGLGANLCGKLLGELGACYLGLSAAAFSSYGSEKRGSPVRAFVRYAQGDVEIRHNSPVTDPNVLVLFHTALWRSVFGEDRAQILNDDKPALRYEDGFWFAYGTPWSGKTDQSLNARFPVAGIAILERHEKNSIAPIEGKEAVVAVMRQFVRHKDPALKIKQLELIDKLLTQVPVWKLKCNMEPEAALVSYEAMSGRK
jgi:Pyruvate/2-oxoacid:ferredoxin oxidoreductase gamma subunit